MFARLLNCGPVTWRTRIQQARRRTKRGTFAWHVSVMLVGTVAGQALSVLFSPILTRLYTAEQFGYLSVYSSLLMILGVVASLGLDLAIPIALSEVECANLLALCGLILAGTTGLLTVLAYVVPIRALWELGLGPVADHLYLLPIGFTFMGGYLLLVAVATRANAFREIARTRIAQGISGPLSQVTLGLLGIGAPGLIVGFVIGQSSGTLLLISRCVLPRHDWFEVISWFGIKNALRRFSHFLLFASWARLLGAAGAGSILFVLFSACYSTQIAGFMFLCERVIWRPLLLVSSSLLQVFTGEAGKSASRDPELLRRRLYQVLPLQALVVTGWIALANLVAAWAFPWLFGNEWGDAIPYLRALSIAYWLQAIVHPFSTTLQLLEHQLTAVLWQIGRLVLLVASIMLAWRHGYSAQTALWFGSSAQAACNLVLLGLTALRVEGVCARRRSAGTQ